MSTSRPSSTEHNPSPAAASPIVRPSRYELWYGRDEPPRAPRALRAGPLTVQLDGADLRYLRLGPLEVVRRIYGAVRDPQWGTVPSEVSQLQVEDAGDSFRVSFEVLHQQGAIEFCWKGTITGVWNGSIVYELDGYAARDFQYNKIGLCLHHPIAGLAGYPYHGSSPHGPISGYLPELVGPQHAHEGVDLPLVGPMSEVTLEMDGGVRIHVAFEGSLAEIEDQRNWSDGSYKTYLPPETRHPDLMHQGDHVYQRITVSVTGPTPSAGPPAGTVEIALGQPLGPLPMVGVGMASDGGELTPEESALLALAPPRHLRADLYLATESYRAELQRSIRAAVSLGAPLELALFVTNKAERELADLSAALSASQPPIARLLLFHEDEQSTSSQWLRLARQVLAPVLGGVALGGGTNAHFCEINRHRPDDLSARDGVVYSVNPQMHAVDELSLAEALAGQADQVRTARSFCGNLPMWVSPVTLRTRSAAATSEEDGGGMGSELPWAVDPRQMSLFAAAWTVGSIKYLAESGAASVTYYETVGWRGLMEREAGPPLPERFPSYPRMVFPLYHVLADVWELQSPRVIQTESTKPLAVVALALRGDHRLDILVANLTAEEQSVTVQPIEAPQVSVRTLDDGTARAAASSPQAFRAGSSLARVSDGRVALQLPPFATARLTSGG